MRFTYSFTEFKRKLLLICLLHLQFGDSKFDSYVTESENGCRLLGLNLFVFVCV